MPAEAAYTGRILTHANGPIMNPRTPEAELPALAETQGEVPRELHLVDEIQHQLSGWRNDEWAKAVTRGETTGATGVASDPGKW